MKEYRGVDDKRVVADMSDLDDRGIMGTWFGILHPSVRAARASRNGSGSLQAEDRHVAKGGFDSRNMGGELDEFSPEDRRALIKYTLKYSLGIGAVFLGAFGLLIFLLLRLWS